MILDCNEIISGKLWVGCYVRPEDVRILRQMEITSIINLQSDRDLAAYNISMKKLVEAYALAEIDLRRIPITDFDRQSLADHLPQAVEELEDALVPRWSKAYVHCTAGINRGPTLAAAYLIKENGLTAQEAYEYVVARRDCSPYLDTLQEYEADLRRMRGV
jgi:protein-tyrosine phosphatase